MNHNDPSLSFTVIEQRPVSMRSLDEGLPSCLVRMVNWALRATLFPKRTIQLAQGLPRR